MVSAGIASLLTRLVVLVFGDVSGDLGHLPKPIPDDSRNGTAGGVALLDVLKPSPHEGRETDWMLFVRYVEFCHSARSLPQAYQKASEMAAKW